MHVPSRSGSSSHSLRYAPPRPAPTQPETEYRSNDSSSGSRTVVSFLQEQFRKENPIQGDAVVLGSDPTPVRLALDLAEKHPSANSVADLQKAVDTKFSLKSKLIKTLKCTCLGIAGGALGGAILAAISPVLPIVIGVSAILASGGLGLAPIVGVVAGAAGAGIASAVAPTAVTAAMIATGATSGAVAAGVGSALLSVLNGESEEKRARAGLARVQSSEPALQQWLMLN